MATSTVNNTIFGITPTKPISVLLLEDEIYYGKLVQRTLRTGEPRFEMTWATSLAMALDLMSEQNFDIILTDLELPDAQRLAAVIAIRKIDARIPIVVLTGHSEPKLGLEAIRDGADDFIIKERVSADTLVRTVCYAVERRRCEDNRLRTEALNDFMGMLAHDLRSPLLGTSRVLEFMDSPEISDEQKAEMLLHLRNANRQMLNLVTELIDVYKYELMPAAMKLQPTKFVSALASVTNWLTPAIQARKQRLDIKLSIEENLLVWTERTALERLLTNLLDNASKFSPEGATIKLSVEKSEDGQVRIDVVDSGPGIPLEIRDTLFKRFWHGSPGKAYSCMQGLGLYICNRIVEAQKGRIWFETSKAGTTFSVTLWQAN